ncbi:hypothetical protein ACB098_12G077900 [Castanea mollissima]|uniref:Uncharacterized protein n=1 Tax=Castanea mollissima TaxID=60419 RepID=A0A8J4R035_9ROSI|nr:hypothetical protein CMV_013071 [Castanea mollissima]
MVSNIKLSTVVPATVSDENNVHELTNMDLVMKLHYIHGAYFFTSEAVQGLSIQDLKKPMFPLLDLYFMASGRVRRSETGRPFIKCNDSGVRIVEAKSDKTIDEALAMEDHSFHDGLAYHQALGPDLSFSPLVFIQFTWFKCGGMCMGLSWAHVLGDAFSASNFINMWGQIISGNKPPERLHVANPGKSKFPPSTRKKATSIKRVDPQGDFWKTTSNCRLETYYFQVHEKQLHHMVTKICAREYQAAKVSHFDVLSAVIWKYLCDIREEIGPSTVTICSNKKPNWENEFPSNGMVISIVEADLSGVKDDLWQVVKLIAEKRVDENSLIEEMVENENGEVDCIVCGANLTLLNLEEAKVYGLEINGHRPIFANYVINGVGDEGAVLVLPGPINGKGEGGCGNGLTVTVVLPESQISLLKCKLERDWNIV